MLKEELDKLTKHESTWEEFEAVEAWYMKAPDATKEKAADLWRYLYLDAAKGREEAARKAAAAERELRLWRDVEEELQRGGARLLGRIEERAARGEKTRIRVGEWAGIGTNDGNVEWMEIAPDYERDVYIVKRYVKGSKGETRPGFIVRWQGRDSGWRVRARWDEASESWNYEV